MLLYTPLFMPAYTVASLAIQLALNGTERVCCRYVGFPDGVGVGDGFIVGVGVAVGLGVADGVGLGVAVGVIVGVGVGDGAIDPEIANLTLST